MYADEVHLPRIFNIVGEHPLDMAHVQAPFLIEYPVALIAIFAFSQSLLSFGETIDFVIGL